MPCLLARHNSIEPPHCRDSPVYDAPPYGAKEASQNIFNSSTLLAAFIYNPTSFVEMRYLSTFSPEPPLQQVPSSPIL